VTYREVAASARMSAGGCAALLGFAIPISTALDNVLLALVVLAWLVAAPACLSDTLRSYVRLRPALLALGVFAALLVSAAYSPLPWKDAASAASKYLELALIPVFVWAAATPRVRKWALLGFLAAIVLNLLVSYGSAFGAWESLPGLRTFPHYPIGFRLSVTHNFFVALAAFVLLLLARELRQSQPRSAMLALGLALVCIHNVLFIVIGRTGQIVLAVLLVYFALTVTRSRRGVGIAMLMLTALLASAYVGSNAFSARVQDVVSDLLHWQPGASDETSVGQRIGYYRTTASIVSEHPLTGVGAGGFEAAYAAKVRGTHAPATSNPHNDYLMIAAQAGLAALALLIALFVMLWRDAVRLASTLERDLLRGIALAFAIGGLFNSFLLDHAEGLLFAWSTGMVYGGIRAAPQGIAGHAA
jgi:O-antigen ligase